MPAHADLDHPRVHLTLDFIVLLLGRALLLLADPAAKASREGDQPSLTSSSAKLMP